MDISEAMTASNFNGYRRKKMYKKIGKNVSDVSE
jgi:hypothetical protein